MILYSEALYSIYLNSGKFNIFFLQILAIYALFNYPFFKGNYIFLLVSFILYALIESILFFSLLDSFNSNWINYPYSIVSIVFPTIFYLKSIQNKHITYISVLVILIFICSLIIQIFLSLKENLPLNSPLLFPLKNLLTISLSLILHTKLLKSTKIKSLKKEPSFWFNFGFFVINFSNFMIVPIFKAVTPLSDDIAFIFGTISQIADPITYTLWAIGIYKLKTQPFRPIASLWP